MEVLDSRDRHQRLAALVRERGFLRVADASRELGVSTVTVRADLSALEGEGRVERVHGGAVAAGLGEQPLEATVSARAEAKRAIGERAASLLDDGHTVLLDVGSTPLAVAHALLARTELRDLTVVTNSLSTALALEPAVPRITVVVTGGTLRPLQHSLVDPFVSDTLAQLTVDVAFVSGTGVDAEGLWNVNLAEAQVKRRLIAAARRSVLLADAAKLGRRDTARVAELTAFESLITDAPTTDYRLAPLAAAGLAVHSVG